MAMLSASSGPMTPGSVFAMFVILWTTPANRGAMSNVLAEVPAIDSPNTALDRARKVTALNVDVPR